MKSINTYRCIAMPRAPTWESKGSSPAYTTYKARSTTFRWNPMDSSCGEVLEFRMRTYSWISTSKRLVAAVMQYQQRSKSTHSLTRWLQMLFWALLTNPKREKLKKWAKLRIRELWVEVEVARVFRAVGWRGAGFGRWRGRRGGMPVAVLLKDPQLISTSVTRSWESHLPKRNQFLEQRTLHIRVRMMMGSEAVMA